MKVEDISQITVFWVLLKHPPESNAVTVDVQTAPSSKTSEQTHHTTQHKNQDDHHLNNTHHENLKTRAEAICFSDRYLHSGKHNLHPAPVEKCICPLTITHIPFTLFSS